MKGIFLAPMLEYNDIAFRRLCKKAGAQMVWTGMINPLSREKFDFSDKPVIQLFCNSIEGVEDFVKKHDSDACMWDFNLGCPSKRAGECEIGAFTRDLKLVESILKIMRASTRKKICIKIRKSKNSFKLLKLAERYCNVICIHPRTKEQGYSGKADLEFALRLKKKAKIPVIYSGDVDENNAKKLLKSFDGVMIGRQALGNPGVFGKKFDFADYLKLAMEHNLEFKNIKIQAMVFTRGMKNASSMREKITKARTIKEIREIFNQRTEI